MFMRYFSDGIGHAAHRDLIWAGQDDGDINGLADKGDEDVDDAAYIRGQSVTDVPLAAGVLDDSTGDTQEPQDDEMDSDDDNDKLMSDGEEDLGEEGEDSGEEDKDEDFEFNDEGYVDI
jgi:hypothetical protein